MRNKDDSSWVDAIVGYMTARGAIPKITCGECDSFREDPKTGETFCWIDLAVITPEETCHL